MIFTARLLTLLAVISCLAGCGRIAPLTPTPVVWRGDPPPPPPPLPPDALRTSPHRLVGRVLAIDRERGFAIIDLFSDAPASALQAGAELLTRTDDLRETGQLRASRYLRTRTLGTDIVSGQPSPGNEVVFRER